MQPCLEGNLDINISEELFYISNLVKKLFLIYVEYLPKRKSALNHC